uniref:Ig-like domain-containing protein n=1 Tax=Xiphophorus maculatus TaxID=8083 RepID=A0A3B5QK47_XIPMA
MSITCSATYFSISAVNFQQLPSVFVRDGDQSVTLRCDQDNNQNYYMFWYRHPAGSGKMELVAYSAGQDTTSVEAPFSKTKYTMTRPEVLRTSLQIHSPEAADSAVYYCASSLAQCFRLPQPPNNNLRRRKQRDQGGKTLKNVNITV